MNDFKDNRISPKTLLAVVLFLAAAVAATMIPWRIQRLIDVGVRCGGVEYATPLRIRASTMDDLMLFLPDETAKEARRAYDLKDGVYLLKGTSVNLSWRCDSGDVERYELTVANGDQVIREALERNSYSFTAQNTGDYIVKLVATPRYARSDADNATASAVVRPHFPTVIEKYWPYGVGLLAVLIALGVGLYFLRQNKAEHVLGTLHVMCEELSFDKLLTFEGGRKGVKLNHPLTDHPELSKLKGKRAHALLSRIRVDMVVANNLGQVVSNDVDPEQARRILEVKHRPNERLIALKYKNPDGKVEACYVGKYDIGESSIAIEDSGKRYAFVFSGN